MSFGAIDNDIKDMARLAMSLIQRAGDEIPETYRTAFIRVIGDCCERTSLSGAEYLGKGKLFNNLIAEKKSFYDRETGKIYEVSFPHFRTPTFYHVDFQIGDNTYNLSRIETVTLGQDGNEFRLSYHFGGRYFAYTYNNRT